MPYTSQSNFDIPMTQGGDGGSSNAYTPPAPFYHSAPSNNFSQDGSPAFNSSLANNLPPDHTPTQSNHEPNVLQAATTATGVKGSKSLACPMVKADPTNYQHCHKFDLSRVFDVKQHLKRRHLLEKHYCPNCRLQWPEGASSELEWDAHVRLGRCEAKSFQETGKLLPEEFKLLKPSSKLSETEKWAYIWEIILPGRPLPKSVYREDIAYREDIENETVEFLRHRALLLPQLLVSFMVKQGHQMSQESATALTLLITETLFDNVPNTASIAGTQPPNFSSWDQSMDTMSGVTDSLQFAPGSNYTLQPQGQHQSTGSSHQHHQSRIGTTVQEGGYVNPQQLQIPQSLPLDPRLFGMGPGLSGLTSNSIAFPNIPNQQQQGSSPLAQVPSFARNGSNISYQRRDANMAQTFTHNLTTQPGHGHNLFSPGQQHPN